MCVWCYIDMTPEKEKIVDEIMKKHAKLLDALADDD